MVSQHSGTPFTGIMAKPKRQRANISPAIVKAALRAATDGDRQYEIGDVIVPGLCLRVRARSATWALRCRVMGSQTTISIGPVIALKDPAYVREIAEKGKAKARLGEHPGLFFKAAVIATEASEAEAIERQKKGKEWTWDELLEHYLEVVKSHDRPSTYRTYRSALHLFDTHILKGKLLTQITPDDIKDIRNSISARGKLRQLSSTMQQIKQSLDWAIEKSKYSGLKVNPAIGVKTKTKAKVIGKEAALADMSTEALLRGTYARVLTDEELGMLLFEAEALPQPSHRLMLTLELFTAQRRLTVASAMKKHFVEDTTKKYGMLWVIHPGLLKAGSKGERAKRPHVIPLPDYARMAVDQAMRQSRSDSPWLFPQLRLRRKGDAGGGHISEKSLNDAMRTLQAEGKPLHSDRPFSPHALRRSFGTWADTARFDRSHVKLVLDHAEGRAGDVTEDHYNANQKLPEKQAILTAWHEYVANLMNLYSASKEMPRPLTELERLRQENAELRRQNARLKDAAE